MKTNLIDPVRNGKGKTIIISNFLFNNSFWHSKDRNLILFFIIIGIALLGSKIVFGSSNDAEIINQITNKYNSIRKEYYEKDNMTINNIEKDINLLSTKKEIYTKCRDYNYARYNTVVEPINCDDILESQMEIIKGWKVNKDGLSQAFKPLISNGVKERMNELLLQYDRGEDVLEDRWNRVASKHNIKAPVLVCIAKADSSIGKALKSSHNVGNVGNNDRGDVVHFATAVQGIEAIAKTLNNGYLGKYNTIDQLSRYGNKEGSIYASSPDNWHNNVINCLSSLYGESISDNFSFRN